MMKEWGSIPYKKYLREIERIDIKEGVRYITTNSFNNCIALKTIQIPSSVKTIGYESFYNCNSLESIEVNENNDIYTSIDGVLYTKDLKTLVKYPDNKEGKTYKVNENVTEIDYRAFLGCKNLEKIILPYGLTKIYDSTFEDSDKLIYVRIPSKVESIDYMVFRRNDITLLCKKDSIVHKMAEESNITYYLNLVSEKYHVKDSTIAEIESGTKLSDFTNNIETVTDDVKVINQENVTIEENDFVGTGMKLLLDEDVEYELVVKGDLNGDGRVTVTDLALVQRKILDSNLKLTDSQLEAGDVDYSGAISIKDLASIQRYILTGKGL